MSFRIIPGLAYLALGTLPLMCQPPESQVPIYRVTVVERTVKAINYEYRSEPTTIDFRGTVLMPKAKGEAVVQSKQGRTAIDVRFDHVGEPSVYGREYLTYVLWALTPDGRPHNLGEIIPNSLDNSHIQVTTALQAFALIVTAEPYSAVRQPSDVVVLENQVRGDTTGIIEQVNARYELLPRGHYAWNAPPDLRADNANQPRVSTREYEELIEIYQAQNAIGAARAAGADRYALDTITKADTLLREAQQRHDRKADRTLAIQEAREAAQSAEDARLISEQRTQQDRLASAEASAHAAQQAKLQADAARVEAQSAARDAQAQREGAEARAAAERDARVRAEQQALVAQNRAAEAQAQLEAQQAQVSLADAKLRVNHQVVERQEAREREQREERARILGQLNAIAPTRDTAYGLVVSLPDAAFAGGILRSGYEDQVGRITRVLIAHPDLQAEVQGHTDVPAGEVDASRRAQWVGDLMVRRGLASKGVLVRSLGDTRPLGPNATARGHEENRRVEIVVSGDDIGSMALWDHPYTLTNR